MVRLIRNQSQIVVADARPADYRDLPRLAGAHAWHVHFLTSGAAAMQFARRNVADLWMVHVRLPDMSGFELLQMLRDGPGGAPVFVVGDRYRSDDERQACRGGAGLYLCKDAAGSVNCQRLIEALMERQTASELVSEIVHPAAAICER